MTLPNFFIIGAAKSGTSSLYKYLKQHPEIYMSPIKEPHFFSFDSESKLTKGPGDPIPKAITDFETYQALYEGVRDEKAVGEASTSYLYRPEAAQRIHDLLPEAKLIAILRNPAERAFSAYMHVLRDGRETADSFAEALKLEEARKKKHWEPIWHFTSVGLYYEQLTRYYNLYERSQIKVFLYEELLHHQQALLKETFYFLGVNPNFAPDISVKFNVSGEQKSLVLYKLSKAIFNQPNPIRWLSRHIFPESWRCKVTNWVREKNLRENQIPPEKKRELMAFYRPDIVRLEELIEMDLSQWLEE